jgi:hypothetical protein
MLRVPKNAHLAPTFMGLHTANAHRHVVGVREAGSRVYVLAEWRGWARLRSCLSIRGNEAMDKGKARSGQRNSVLVDVLLAIPAVHIALG